MVTNEQWHSHNHGPDEGPGMYCTEKPIGQCVRDAKDAELAELRHTLDGLRDLRVEDYAKLDQAYDRTHEAEDALRAERAKVARVEALLSRNSPMFALGEVRAALAGPPELEYPDLAYAVQKGGPNLDGPTMLTDEPTGDAMRWTKDERE